MEINVLLLPQTNNSWERVEKRAVVIDVLRASSTIVTALANNATEIIPTVESNEVIDLVHRLGAGECVTGGERKGYKIEGFELGNSPLEYTKAKVGGKKVLFCTSNGTRAIKNAQGAAEVLIGSFLNINALVDYLKTSDQDLTLICAGMGNNMSLEDLALAGMIIHLLQESQTNLHLTDEAKVAKYVWENAMHNLDAFIRNTKHGRYLAEIGMAEDIEACITLNKSTIIPRYYNGKISLKDSLSLLQA